MQTVKQPACEDIKCKKLARKVELKLLYEFHTFFFLLFTPSVCNEAEKLSLISLHVRSR